MQTPEPPSLRRSAVWLTIERKYEASGARIETLIRQHGITAGMARSLISDIEYAFETCRDLVNMSKLIFTDSARSILYNESGVELDRDDIAEIVRQQLS